MRAIASILTLGCIALLAACNGLDGLSADHASAPWCPFSAPANGSPCSADSVPADGCPYADVPHCPGAPDPVSTCGNGSWNTSGGLSGKKCASDGDSGNVTTCAPGDVSTFTPAWKPPTAFNQGKCTDAQIAAFVDCLSGIPDAATCKTFGADVANKACIACAATPSTASGYGPLIEGTVTIQVNIPGCIANTTGDVSTTGCGAKGLALIECKSLACEGNCPVPVGDDGTDFNALLACQDKSVDTTCKTYATAASCADALTSDGGAASQCNLAGASFRDNAIPMIKLFCGGVIVDAGAGDGG